MADDAYIYFDYETHLFRPGMMAPKAVSIAYTDADGDIQLELAHLCWATDMLEASAILVAQYAAFDMRVIASNYDLLAEVFAKYENGEVYCTKIAQQLIDIRNGAMKRGKGAYSLGKLAEPLGFELDKSADSFRLRYSELDGVPVEDWPSAAIQYAVQDVHSLRALHKAQQQEDDLPTLQAEVIADFCLALMSARGIRVDQERLAGHYSRARRLLKDATDELAKGDRFLKASKASEQYLVGDYIFGLGPLPKMTMKKKAVTEFVVENLPADSLPRTPTGQVQLTEDVLAEAELYDIITYKQETKKISTYLDPLWVGEHPIHAYFNCIGAQTSRQSSVGPNMQNQPPWVRDVFVPREGYVFIDVDYSAQELRTWAQTCFDLFGRSVMGDAFKKDRDIDTHGIVAASLLGIPFSQFDRGLPDHEAKRKLAKIMNFGLLGGMGATAFRTHLARNRIYLSEDEVKAAITVWKKTWEVFDYFDHCSRTAELVGGYTVPRSGFSQSNVGYTEIANGYFQSLAAHCTKNALVKVTKACYLDKQSPLYGTYPVIVVHDQIVAEAPVDKAEEALKEMMKLMIEGQEELTPDVPAAVEGEIRTEWGK